MGRIENKEKDVTITGTEELLGTAKDNSNKTSNYSIDSIANYTKDKIILEGEGFVIITWENLILKTDREAGQKYDITGSINIADDFGKVLLRTSNTFDWIDGNGLNNTVNIT